MEQFANNLLDKPVIRMQGDGKPFWRGAAGKAYTWDDTLGGAGPEAREAVNRLSFVHELDEIGKHFGNKKLHGQKNLGGIASHMSTRPMLLDLNRAATWEGPGGEAADFFRRIRAREVEELNKYVPGLERLNLGQRRLSRSAQKRIQQIYEKNRSNKKYQQYRAYDPTYTATDQILSIEDLPADIRALLG